MMNDTESGILSDKSEVSTTRGAAETNIEAGHAVGELLRTTLGPSGMDKLLIDTAGMGIVTNDGASILKEMSIDHPAANMVARAALRQKELTGDGATTVATVAGQLLREGRELRDEGFHPQTIAEGYALAAAETEEALTKLADPIDADEDALRAVVESALTGHNADSTVHRLVELVVDVALSADRAGRKPSDFVRIEKSVGGRIEDSQRLCGGVLKKERAHTSMPWYVEDPNVVVLDDEFPPTETPGSVRVSDPTALDDITEREERRIDRRIERLHDLDVDAVISQQNIDEVAQQRLANAGMYAARRQSPDDVTFAAEATGATVVRDVLDLRAEDLGDAGRIGERSVDGEPRTVIEETDPGRAATLLLQGGTRTVIDEVHRSVEDGLGAVTIALKDESTLPGGGAPETSAARHLREFAPSIADRTQRVVEAYADALEVIPRTLAENAGYSSLDTLVALRHAHKSGDSTVGIEAKTGEITDMMEAGIVDPLRLKTSALASATDVAVLILRIDDIITAGEFAGGWFSDDSD